MMCGHMHVVHYLVDMCAYLQEDIKNDDIQVSRFEVDQS